MSTSIHREFTGITDAAVDALRQRIGIRIENTLEPWCHEATRDNIRHYAHGIGDDNPCGATLSTPKARALGM